MSTATFYLRLDKSTTLIKKQQEIMKSKYHNLATLVLLYFTLAFGYTVVGQNTTPKQLNEHLENPPQNSILAKIAKAQNHRDKAMAPETATAFFDKGLLTNNPLDNQKSQDADYEFHEYIGRGNNIPFDAVTDSDGNTYITGTTSNTDAPQGNFIVIKLDAQGNQVWEKEMEAEDFQVAMGLNVALDPDENPVVSGITWNNNQVDALTIKLDRTNGNQLWESVFNNSNNTLDVPTAITIAPSGEIIIAGMSYTQETVQYMLLKYDVGGNLLWSQIDTAPIDNSWNEPTAVSVHQNNTIAVTGFGAVHETPEGYFEGYKTQLFDSNGQQLWSNDFLFERHNDETDPNSDIIPTHSSATGLSFDSIGNVYVTGTFDATSNSRIGSVKYSPLGIELWVNTHRAGTQNNHLTNGHDIKITSDDKIFVGGRHREGWINEGLVLIAYDATGNEEWIQETEDIIQIQNCYLSLDENEFPVMAGVGNIEGTFDKQFKVVQFDQLGTIMNESAIVKPESDFEGLRNFVDMNLDDQDNVFLTIHNGYTDKGDVFETIKLPIDSGTNNPDWEHIFEKPESTSSTRMLNAQTDNNSNIYATGDYGVIENLTYYRTFFVAKYNEDGEVAWEKSFNELNDYPANGIIAQTNTDDELIVVLLPDSNNAFPMRILKYDAQGSLIWDTEKTMYNALLNTIFIDDNNNIHIAGSAKENTSDPNPQFVTLKFADNGDELWTSFDMTDEPDDFIFQINQGVADSNGNIYLTGTSGVATMFSEEVDPTVLKYNADGELQWVNKYPQTDFSAAATHIKIGSEGAIYTSGVRQETVMMIEELFALKLDDEGTLLWEMDYGQSDINRRIRPYDLFFNSNGNLVIPSYSLYWAPGEPTNNRITTIQIDQNNGTVNWENNTDINRFFADAYIDANDDFYILNQVGGSPMPQGFFGGYSDAELTVIDNSGTSEAVHFDTPYLNLYTSAALCPLQNGKLMIGGHLYNEFSIFSGLYFFEHTHQPLHLDEIDDPASQTNRHALFQNYPNPAQLSTTIPFYLKHADHVTINLYNSNGQMITQLADTAFPKGHNTVEIDVSALDKGVYFYELNIGKFRQARKLIKR